MKSVLIILPSHYFYKFKFENNRLHKYCRTRRPSDPTLKELADVKGLGNAAYARFTQHVHENTVRTSQAEAPVFEKQSVLGKLLPISIEEIAALPAYMREELLRRVAWPGLQTPHFPFQD